MLTRELTTRTRSTVAIAVLAAFTASARGAQEQPAFNRADAVASCYRALSLSPPQVTESRAYFVLIDQTTIFDASLRQTIATATRDNLKWNTQFAIASFSAYLGDRYADIALAGRTDAPLSQDERDDTSKTKLRNLDQCMARQIDYARRIADMALQKSFGAASTDIARSDILASLYDFATHVVHPSGATAKTLLIASDMLENSSLTSFYARRAVRKLDAAAELRQVREKGLIPDLTGVRVFVIGAGLLDPQSTASGAYRDPQTMQALEAFWSAYFKEAHAQLVELGKPQLLGAVE